MTGPIVKLVDFSHNPFDLAIASARTCYSKKGIVTPAEVSSTEQSRLLRDRIARSTYKAGHLTTRQHPNFVFTIERVSRHLVWSFLHSHPYYNSEQVSQRYVEVKPEDFYTPPSLSKNGRDPARELYLKTVQFATQTYHDFISLLRPVVSTRYFQIFHARLKKSAQWEGNIDKKAMEVARYFLPVATLTRLYHTINGLTLHRYIRLANTFDVPEETRLLTGQMYAAVRAVDSLYADEIEDPLPLEETPEFQFFDNVFGRTDNGSIKWDRRRAVNFIKEFDYDMGELSSRLIECSPDGEKTLSASIRAVLGILKSELTNTETISMVLDPKRNKRLQSTLNETTLHKVTRALFNVHYVFKKKISHTADSQDQRHRLVPGARPVLLSHFTGIADYITPLIIKENQSIREIYDKKMETLFELIGQFINSGGTMEEAIYLLPNAFPIRFFESGDLLNLHHKWRSRLCYNAQEEIFHASVEELKQVAAIHPEITRWIKAPCWLRNRAGARPYCPEGDRFCGVPVWEINLDAYSRIL